MLLWPDEVLRQRLPRNVCTALYSRGGPTCLGLKLLPNPHALRKRHLPEIVRRAALLPTHSCTARAGLRHRNG